MYRDLVKNYNNIKANIQINFVQGAKVEILSPVDAEYFVEFINKKTGKIIHSSTIQNNCWTKCLYEYFIDWNIKVYQKENDKLTLLEDYHYNATNKRVYIAFDSKALGDTLAWISYVEEFRKKHNCKVICSTFLNELFEKQYLEIEFIKPGDIAHNLYAMYTFGWSTKEDSTINSFKHPNNIRIQNLQELATDILGLDFIEIRPKLAIPKVSKRKQVTIAIHSTAQAKYWNNPTGWQEVVDWCSEKGYEVVLLSREGDGYMNNMHPSGIKRLESYSIDNIVKELYKSEFFIGISSGLSWLAWATGIPTVLISGFTDAITEPASCYRIEAPEEICHGCWSKFKLDAGDWNWCPIYKGTDKQFECSKLITGAQVIEVLTSLMGKL